MNLHNINLQLRDNFKEVFGKVRRCNAEWSRGTTSLLRRSIRFHGIFTLGFWRSRMTQLYRCPPGGATAPQTCSIQRKPNCTLQNTNQYPTVTMEMKRLPTHHKVNHTYSITESLRSVIYKVSSYFFHNWKGVYLLCCTSWILIYIYIFV